MFVAVLILLASCSKYNRILKSNDSELKYNAAVEYFKQKKYSLVIPLMEDLIPIYRGTQKGEYVAYYRSMSYYYVEDYIFAGAYLKMFAKTFPKSEFAEECSFLAAMCTYNQSPKFSLDQTDTHGAINEFQLFLNKFPESARTDTVNKIMIICRAKLERKSFEISKLYFKTQKFKSAVIALENTLRDFPNTRYEEDLLIMILKANYELAQNSVEEKTKERLEATLKAYQRYIDKYSQSPNSKEAEGIYKVTIQQLEKRNKPQLSSL